MRFTSRELVTLEEALRDMVQTSEVQKLLARVLREKPRKLMSVIPNRTPRVATP